MFLFILARWLYTDPICCLCVICRTLVLCFVFSGQCTVYNGNVCPTMKGKEVFVMSGVTNVVVSVIENQIQKISKTLKVSQQCSRYIRPLLCHLRLPECDKTASTPKAKPICKNECLSLKNDFCQKEYAEVGQSTTSDIFFDCSTVPKFTVASGKCSSIGITQCKSGVFYFILLALSCT